MPHLRNSLLLLLALLAFSVRTPAQQPASTADTRPAEAALRKKAFDLLETLADQIGTLQSGENRARLGSNIAASLWKHDEQRARSLLASVETDIKAGLQTVDEDERAKLHTRMVFHKLRMDTVERIAKLDAEQALAFLKATELNVQKPRLYGASDLEQAFELALAKQIAADKPEIALKLGRQSLARGFSADLLSLLTRLQRKHREHALILYKEIVTKLRDDGLAPSTDASYFAVRLAQSWKPPLADELTYRELISLFITAALKNGCGNKMQEEHERAYFCNQIGSLLAQMEQIDPLRAAQFKQWEHKDSPQWFGEYSNELTDLFESGTVDEVLAMAQKYPNMSHQIYWQAMSKAEASGDIERARKIVTDYIHDPDARRLALARLDRAQRWDAMNVEKLAEAQRILITIPRIQERVKFLLFLANRLGPNDRKTALKLLDQASDVIDTMKPGTDRTDAELMLAMMYCAEKSDRGLTIMQMLLPKLNDLVAAAVKLDGYDSHYLREGEWNMSMNGAIGVLLAKLSQNAGYFAWYDFDQAVSMAAQFERPEIRLMAQLKLAQAILAGPPKRITFTPYISFH